MTKELRFMSTSQTPELGHITQTWTYRHGFLYLKKSTVSVEAKQILPEGFTLHPAAAAEAEVTIYHDGEKAVTIKIHYPGLVGDLMLPLQVYVFTQSPEGRGNFWKNVLLTFCSKCEGFDKYGKPKGVTLFWGVNPFLS